MEMMHISHKKVIGALIKHGDVTHCLPVHRRLRLMFYVCECKKLNVDSVICSEDAGKAFATNQKVYGS